MRGILPEIIKILAVLRDRRNPGLGIEDGEQPVPQRREPRRRLQFLLADRIVRPHPVQGLDPRDILEPQIRVIPLPSRRRRHRLGGKYRGGGSKRGKQHKAEGSHGGNGWVTSETGEKRLSCKMELRQSFRATPQEPFRCSRLSYLKEVQAGTNRRNS